MGAKKVADGWEREWGAAKAEGLVLAQGPPADHLLTTTAKTLAKGVMGITPEEGG